MVPKKTLVGENVLQVLEPNSESRVPVSRPGVKTDLVGIFTISKKAPS
jgi:hypothetical protein